MVLQSSAARILCGGALRFFLVVWLLVLVGGDFLSAQSARYRRAEIRGQVLPAKGELRLPPTVTVKLTHRESRFQEVTDGRSGNFSFQYLGNGYYTLEVSAPGYETNTQSVLIEGALRGQTLALNLRLGELIGGRPDIPQPGKSMTVSTGDLVIPRKVQQHLEKAAEASQANQPEEAVRHYRRALDKFPKLPRAWNNMAVQYLKLGQAQKARESFLQALHVNPTDISANFNLALILVSQREFHEALDNLQILFQLQPEDMRVRGLLAESYLQTGHYQLALRHYLRVSREDPDNPEWLVRISDCYVRLGIIEEAIASLERFLARSSPGERQTSVRSQLSLLRNLRPGGECGAE